MSKDKRQVTKQEIGKEIKAGVVEAKKGNKAKFKAPPAPPVALNGVENPMIGKKGLKRALAVAIVGLCTNDGKVDETKAGIIIRTSGILYKAGYTEEEPTEELTTSEWSGRPYARFVTSTPEGKVYVKKHPEKVEKCVAFAKELVAAEETHVEPKVKEEAAAK